MVNFRNNLYNYLMAFVLQEMHLNFNKILTNYDHYKYLECDVIKYLYIDNKIIL